MNCEVYVLVDPTDLLIKYVGFTTNRETRRKHHESIKTSTSHHSFGVDGWSGKLAAIGHPVIYETVREFGEDRWEALKFERQMIVFLAKEGLPLYNIANMVKGGILQTEGKVELSGEMEIDDEECKVVWEVLWD